MAIRVALQHVTRYKYDRLVTLAPHEVRLRPAPHARTPILSYSLSVSPETHFVNWQQDPYGNFSARYVFPKETKELVFTVALVADMTVINPFDFFVEKYAEVFPFVYPARVKSELAPYLNVEVPGPHLTKWLEALKKDGPLPGTGTTDFLVEINRRLMGDIRYLVRLEPGIQTCEETLEKRCGSCRDSAWLLVQIFRHLGLAARFVSGYLIQLAADVKSLDGPSGPEKDFTDLHAWTEVYIPGAGWIGLDPTSGLMAGEGHIPLACTAVPGSAAPISGLSSVAGVEFEFEMSVIRMHEDPRVTKPFSDEQWEHVQRLGKKVDAELIEGDVRLTQGGEPTFVSIDNMDGPEWNIAALSPEKRHLAGKLAERLHEKFAPGGMYHFGQGKWYPGEPLPRWALGLYWRKDGRPIWKEPGLVADQERDYGYKSSDAKGFSEALANALELSKEYVIPAYEDVWQAIRDESQVPVNLDPLAADLKDPAERRRLARLLERGLGEVVGYVLPLKAVERKSGGGPAETVRIYDAKWLSSRWPLRREHCYLVAGDSPMGLRLPLATLPWVDPSEKEVPHSADPFDMRRHLDDGKGAGKLGGVAKEFAKPEEKPEPKEVIHTALCVEVRGGCLYVFMPPLGHLEDYLALVGTVESVAKKLNMPVCLEGYTPPRDPRVQSMNITPDPGVIEVNIHPCSSWEDLVATTTTLYEEARRARLGTEKFMLDGRHTGTGGGNHITFGGATPADSPLLRRPDVLKSLITYWQNHPALSYLFSGQFVGPTSQAPRADEARDDNLYELEIAFQQMERVLPEAKESGRPWLVDRLLRNLLVDLTGNTHRAEFCIDKLYSPDGPAGRLGLVEFRAFEMPPHAQMSLLQSLLVRALVARFWKEPYKANVLPWGTRLHDQFMLPHFVMQDIRDVVRDLNVFGYAFQDEWFAPFVEFRFPRYGSVVYQGVELELRQAIEPWNVLGEEMSANSTARYVDSSIERLQVKVRGLTGGRHMVACNGRMVPLHPTGVHGELVAGVRFRAWAPPSALHPTIGVHAPLTFDVVDRWSERAIGGCTYHVSHPGGRNYNTFPVNANEAEARRFARFWEHGHTPGPMSIPLEHPNPNYPMTLDLRREPTR
ncbi:MAG: transglutaminase family protein [Verrucomicrobiota bacterium]